jgi:hypothetical protein
MKCAICIHLQFLQFSNSKQETRTHISPETKTHSENFNYNHTKKTHPSTPMEAEKSTGKKKKKKVNTKLQNPVIELRALISFHTFPSNQTEQTTN